MLDTPIKRWISLEHDFMDLKKDDKMYIYLITLTNYRKKDNLIWLDKQVYYSNKDYLMDLCGYKSQNSLRNNMKKWLDCGLIEEGTVEYSYNDETVKVQAYIFKNYDEVGKYQLVDLEILKKLINVKNKHSIQIYVYLLSKYLFKKNYEFTLLELREAMNLSRNTNNRDSLLKDILEDLYVSGYIKWEIIYKEEMFEKRKIKYPVKVLKFVAQKTRDLPKAEWLPKDFEREEKRLLACAQDKYLAFREELSKFDEDRVLRLFKIEHPKEYDILFK